MDTKLDQSKRRVLIISRNYAPDAEVGAKRVTHISRYLPEYNIEPIVLTVEDRYYDRVDPSFEIPGGVRVERTELQSALMDFYKSLKRQSKEEPNLVIPEPSVEQFTKKRSPLRRMLRSVFQGPNRAPGWYRPAMTRAKAIIEDCAVETIFSSGPPWTSHLVALALKKKYGIPWIADFRDAWTLDLWKDVLGDSLSLWPQAWDRYQESQCIRYADLVSCVTEAMREQFLAHYPKVNTSKFVTLTNGYTDILPVATTMKKEEDDRKLFLHLGSLYGDRRIDTFCEAIEILWRQGKLDPASIKVLFVGGVDDSSLITAARQRAASLMATDCIEFRSTVPWEEAQRLLSKADLLLLFQGSHKRALSAKFFEYLQSGIPILAIVEQGALSEMIQNTGAGLSVDPSDSLRIAGVLLKALSLNARPHEEVKRATKNFHFRAITGRLAEHIRSLIS